MAEATNSHTNDSPDEWLFAGDGEMRALCREMDWTSTPLGPVSGWTRSLRTTAAMVLASRNPMFLWWGSELVQIYNDAYRPSFGEIGRHPSALGMRGRECWTDIWEAIGPQIEQVMTTGDATWHEDQHLPIQRNGRLEDVWWTYSYSPVRDDDGSIAGTLVVCQETTARILGERERERLVAERTRIERGAARVLEQVADEYLMMDSEFRILTVNAAAEVALGIPASELRGKTYWKAFPSSVGTKVEQNYRLAMRDQIEMHFETHYVREGYDRHLEIDVYPTEDRGLALFWREVSDRKRAEQSLRESEARYRALFESLDQGFCVVELLADETNRVTDYRFLETNPAFVKQTGFVDAVGRTIREVQPDVDAHWFDTYARVLESGEPRRFEGLSAPLQRWFDVYAFPVGNPKDRRIAILFNDVSDSHAAKTERERLLRALELESARLAYVFRHAPTFLAVLRGPDLVFELVNDAYQQLVGKREMLGRTLLEALPEVRDQGFFELLDEVLQTGTPYVGREMPILLVRTPGAVPEERFVDFVYLPLLDANGERDGIIAHGTDVTDQVRARREIERLYISEQHARSAIEDAYRVAEAANRAKSEFLAIMSHELRTPLNAIGGYAELLEMGIRGPVTPQQRDDLRRIQTSQRHLLGLINEVLNYAKLETGTVHYDVDDVIVREALAMAESLVAPQARAKGLTLVISDCPEFAVRADMEKLRQILVNLLSNAVKFTDAGGRIEITCESEGEFVLLHVLDTGMGIPADKLQVIFDPFVQVRADLTRTHEGTGLGLAISRDLARGMGGDLTVTSVPDRGSTFSLSLPRVVATDE